MTSVKLSSWWKFDDVLVKTICTVFWGTQCTTDIIYCHRVHASDSVLLISYIAIVYMLQTSTVFLQHRKLSRQSCIRRRWFCQQRAWEVTGSDTSEYSSFE